jgi:hypothetical protein
MRYINGQLYRVIKNVGDIQGQAAPAIYSFVSVDVRSFSLIVFGIVSNFALFPCPAILFDMISV